MSATPEVLLLQNSDRAEVQKELEEIKRWYGQRSGPIHLTDGERIRYNTDLDDLLVLIVSGASMAEIHVKIYTPSERLAWAPEMKRRIEHSKINRPT